MSKTLDGKFPAGLSGNSGGVPMHLVSTPGAGWISPGFPIWCASIDGACHAARPSNAATAGIVALIPIEPPDQTLLPRCHGRYYSRHSQPPAGLSILPGSVESVGKPPAWYPFSMLPHQSSLPPSHSCIHYRAIGPVGTAGITTTSRCQIKLQGGRVTTWGAR